MAYFVYMLRCGDGSIYTGITTDPERRLKEHKGGGKGAKYTAAHRPLGYEAIWSAADRASASSLECRIKKLTKAQKERLAAGQEPEGLALDAYERLL